MPDKRWTELVVSHDSDAPRTISVSERVVRVAASIATFVVLIALIGIGALVAQLGNLPSRPWSAAVDSAGTPATARAMRGSTRRSSPEVVRLRNQVSALRGALDTIQLEDARLRATAGISATDSSTLVRRFLSRLPAFLRTKPRIGGTDTDFLRDSLAPGDSLSLRAFAQRATSSADSLTGFAGDIAKGFRTLTSDVDRSRSARPAQSVLLERAAWETTPVELRTATGIEWRVLRETRLLASRSGEARRVAETAGELWEVELVDLEGAIVRIRSRGRPLVDVGERVIREQPVFVVDSLGESDRLRIDWLSGPSTIP